MFVAYCTVLKPPAYCTGAETEKRLHFPLLKNSDSPEGKLVHEKAAVILTGLDVGITPSGLYTLLRLPFVSGIKKMPGLIN